MNQSRDKAVSLILGGAVFLQGIMLLYLGQLATKGCIQTVLISSTLAIGVQQAWHYRRELNHRVDMALVMLACGGLGMILGWWIDFGLSPAPLWMRLGLPNPMHRGFLEKVFSWMTGLMLVAGIPPSLVWTRCAALAKNNLRLIVSTHVIGNIVMVVGMILINQFYGRALGKLMGSLVIGAHVAMLVGMVGGMVAGMWLGEAALGLRPWRGSVTPNDQG